VNLQGMKLIKIVYKASVPTSQRTQST